LVDAGLERFTLWRRDFGWELAGTVVTSLHGEPGEVRYRVECDPAWVTRRVEATALAGEAERSLMLTVDEDLRWARDGEDIPELKGCLDVDLGVSPSTNTLPIRRLQLSAGEGAGVDAAWVGFPNLELERLSQRYSRLTENRYRYRSPGGDYEIDVDDLGLVVVYHGAFERVPGSEI
jgi:hypothetical protein